MVLLALHASSIAFRSVCRLVACRRDAVVACRTVVDPPVRKNVGEFGHHRHRVGVFRPAYASNHYVFLSYRNIMLRVSFRIRLLLPWIPLSLESYLLFRNSPYVFGFFEFPLWLC